MCCKDLYEQYTPDDIVLLICTALLFNLMSVLQMLFIFLICVVHKTNMPSTVFHYQKILIENVSPLLCVVNSSNYVHQAVCKIKVHSSGIICGSRETTSKLNATL